METAEGNALISLRGVSVTLAGRRILTGVNLDVEPEDFVAVTGPNGGGKTTLLRVMLGLLKPSEGTVVSTNPSIGYLPQKNAVDSNFPITVGDVIAQGLLSAKGDIDRKGLTQRAAEMTGVASLVERPIGELSGGQLQRTLLARALAPKPRLLVLDEPLSYLDKKHEHEIYDLLRTLKPSTAIVLVSHEMSGFAPMATKHIIVDGRVHLCSAKHHNVYYDC